MNNTFLQLQQQLIFRIIAHIAAEFYGEIACAHVLDRNSNLRGLLLCLADFTAIEIEYDETACGLPLERRRHRANALEHVVKTNSQAVVHRTLERLFPGTTAIQPSRHQDRLFDRIEGDIEKLHQRNKAARQ